MRNTERFLELKLFLKEPCCTDLRKQVISVILLPLTVSVCWASGRILSFDMLYPIVLDQKNLHIMNRAYPF